MTLAEPRILAAGFTFLEAPRWHEGKLWCSEFYAQRVITVDEQGKVATIVEVPQQPSGLGWTPQGEMLVVSMLDRKLLKLSGRKLTELADLSGIATGPCNDMVVDAKGRAYVGNFGFDLHKGETLKTAALMRVDQDGSVHRAADDLAFPNGSVITQDGKRLIVAETFGNRLSVFDIADDGALSNRRVFAAVDGMYPDGICLDQAGAVWVADAREGRALRLFEGGRIAATIPLKPRNAYACMLGGPDRKTLYLLTGAGSGPVHGAKMEARIETVRVEVPGAGLP